MIYIAPISRIESEALDPEILPLQEMFETLRLKYFAAVDGHSEE